MRSTDLTYYYMRYAEVLLIYAEAMAQQDGGLKEALNALNEIRARVDLPAVSASTKTEFMKLLRRERMIELAFEGHRFWDLRRWGLGTTVLNGTHMKGVKPTKVGDNLSISLWIVTVVQRVCIWRSTIVSLFHWENCNRIHHVNSLMNGNNKNECYEIT